MNYFDCHADTLTEIISGETLDQNSGDLDLNRLGDFVENLHPDFCSVEGCTEFK